MKKLVFLMLCYSVASYGEEFNFTWYLGRDKFQYRVSAFDKPAALKLAASMCFEKLVAKYRPKTENDFENIIDICVNPK